MWLVAISRMPKTQMLRYFGVKLWCSFEQFFLWKNRYNQIYINSYYIKGPTEIAYKSRTGHCLSVQGGGDTRRGHFSSPERPRPRPWRTVPGPGLRRNLRRFDPCYCPKRTRKPSRVLIYVSIIPWQSYGLIRSPMPVISRFFDTQNKRKTIRIKMYHVLYRSLYTSVYSTIYRHVVCI